MDTSWMQKGRCHPDYFRGCDEFINFAWSHRTPDLGWNINKLWSKESIPISKLLKLISFERQRCEVIPLLHLSLERSKRKK
ncbi:hypothetical protein C5167_004522 [Papaver somniferum]|uniref:Uncharacterized protein n=1 Tax=Papaver somniferum TaxID=3469 RepID=A0A4Y7JBQ1_PAPSO|nr:hypothetical protein C5167_004522 [Papaver somniferum]